MGKELKRLNINMPVDLIARIDEYADKMCINRSSAVNVLCNLSLDGQKTMNTLDELMVAYKLSQMSNDADKIE